jgi:ketosteroid isomerase-like protein
LGEEDVMMIAREAVERDYEALEEAYHKGDADTISLMYEEDAELFFPGAPVLEGRPAIREAWRRIIGSGGNTVRADIREVQELGEWADDTGRFTARAPDGRVLADGKWISIRRRQSSGEWKIHRDFFHWDVPPAQASVS